MNLQKIAQSKFAQKIASAAFVCILLVGMFAPTLSLYAETTQAPRTDLGLIPCDGSKNNPCTFAMLMELLSRLIKFAFYIIIIVLVGVIIYTGFLYMTSGGDSGKVKRAKGMIQKIVIGLLIMASAWLIVKLITSALLDTGYSYF